MDARNLTFQDEFDRAFSNAALHWIANQRPVLEGVKRSLKSGGRLLFQMAGKGNARDVVIVMNELVAVEPWRRLFADFVFPYGFYDPTQYSEFLEDAGLVPERVELFPKDMQFPDVEGFAAWIRTCWLPFTERVPEAQRTEFMGQIIARYLQVRPQDAAGGVHVDMMRIEVQAHKP
jgi:trans-aconitate methyltransferase